MLSYKNLTKFTLPKFFSKDKIWYLKNLCYLGFFLFLGMWRRSGHGFWKRRFPILCFFNQVIQTFLIYHFLLLLLTRFSSINKFSLILLIFFFTLSHNWLLKFFFNILGIISCTLYLCSNLGVLFKGQCGWLFIFLKSFFLW